MVTEFIVEGLKVALSKGDSMQRAMDSFYNAGYDPREVEEAARNLNQPNQEAIPQQQNFSPTPTNSSANIPMQINSPQNVSVQQVSNYEQQPQNKRKKMVIILASSLGFLLIVLAGLFFFMM